MMSLVRLGGVVAAAALLALPAQAQSLKPWRQAMIMPKADAGFFLMAAKRGFAEREGLKVDVLDVKDDPIGMKALLSGEVDSYEGVYGAIAASARGADVKLLGCNWHAAPYVMLARPGIDRIEDLRGKSVAASSPGTPPDMVARAALVSAKVPPAEVKIAAVGGDRDRFTALLGGVVDAAVVSNEYLPLPAVKSMRVLVEARQILPRFLRFCTLMTGKTARGRHPLHGRADEGAALRRDPPRGDHRAGARSDRRQARRPAPGLHLRGGFEAGRGRSRFLHSGGEPGLVAGSDDRARPARQGRRHQQADLSRDPQGSAGTHRKMMRVEPRAGAAGVRGPRGCAVARRRADGRADDEPCRSATWVR
jgi:hypothetical protein